MYLIEANSEFSGREKAPFLKGMGFQPLLYQIDRGFSPEAYFPAESPDVLVLKLH
jgi:hypothetical protein